MTSPPRETSAPPERLTVLFADITGSTSLFEKSGDARAQQLVDTSIAAMVAKTQENRGTVVKALGDGIMAWFRSADDAIQAARAMQMAHADQPLKIRVGLQFGPVLSDNWNDKDIVGDVVNTAARLAKWAAVAEIITTADTVEQLSPIVRDRTVDLGSTFVSGKEKPLHVFRVVWQEGGENTIDETVFGGGPRAAPAGRDVRLLLRYKDSECVIGPARPQLSIGRHSANDLVVSGEHASKQHAKIEFRNGRFKWTDVSKNGSFVKGVTGHLRVVRRDSVELTGSGLIGLGQEPVSGSRDVIQFRCLVADS